MNSVSGITDATYFGSSLATTGCGTGSAASQGLVGDGDLQDSTAGIPKPCREPIPPMQFLTKGVGNKVTFEATSEQKTHADSGDPIQLLNQLKREISEDEDLNDVVKQFFKTKCDSITDSLRRSDKEKLKEKLLDIIRTTANYLGRNKSHKTCKIPRRKNRYRYNEIIQSIALFYYAKLHHSMASGLAVLLDEQYVFPDKDHIADRCLFSVAPGRLGSVGVRVDKGSYKTVKKLVLDFKPDEVIIKLDSDKPRLTTEAKRERQSGFLREFRQYKEIREGFDQNYPQHGYPDILFFKKAKGAIAYPVNPDAAFDRVVMSCGRPIDDYLDDGCSLDVLHGFFDNLIEDVSRLHQIGYVHLDIKTDNTLVMSEKAILIDFGFVQFREEIKGRVQCNVCTTPPNYDEKFVTELMHLDDRPPHGLWLLYKSVDWFCLLVAVAEYDRRYAKKIHRIKTDLHNVASFLQKTYDSYCKSLNKDEIETLMRFFYTVSESVYTNFIIAMCADLGLDPILSETPNTVETMQAIVALWTDREAKNFLASTGKGSQGSSE